MPLGSADCSTKFAVRICCAECSRRGGTSVSSVVTLNPATRVPAGPSPRSSGARLVLFAASCSTLVGRSDSYITFTRCRKIGDVLRTIAVQHRAHRTPHAGLRVAAHAVRAEQAAGVADAPIDARAARTVQQPRVHLRQVIVHRELHRLPRGSVYGAGRRTRSSTS